jgi:hypothetical protein
MDGMMVYTVGIHRHVLGIGFFFQIVRTGGICRKRVYNSAAQRKLQYLYLNQNLRLPVFPVS